MPDATPSTPYRQVRAQYDDDTIAAYQAYPSEITEHALAARTFVEPSNDRRNTSLQDLATG